MHLLNFPGIPIHFNHFYYGCPETIVGAEAPTKRWKTTPLPLPSDLPPSRIGQASSSGLHRFHLKAEGCVTDSKRVGCNGWLELTFLLPAILILARLARVLVGLGPRMNHLNHRILNSHETKIGTHTHSRCRIRPFQNCRHADNASLAVRPTRAVNQLARSPADLSAIDQHPWTKITSFLGFPGHRHISQLEPLLHLASPIKSKITSKAQHQNLVADFGTSSQVRSHSS